MAGLEDIDYEVAEFLDHRLTDNGVTEYLVRWKGFNSDWDTWEPVASLGNCQKLINRFHKCKKQSNEGVIENIDKVNAKKESVYPSVKLFDKKKSVKRKKTQKHFPMKKIAGDYKSGNKKGVAVKVVLVKGQRKVKLTGKVQNSSKKTVKRSSQKSKNKRELIAVDNEITLSVVKGNLSKKGETFDVSDDKLSARMSEIFKTVLSRSHGKESSQNSSRNQNKKESFKAVKKTMSSVKTENKMKMRKTRTRSMEEKTDKIVKQRTLDRSLDLNRSHSSDPQISVKTLPKGSHQVALSKGGLKSTRSTQKLRTQETIVKGVAKMKSSPKGTQTPVFEVNKLIKKKSSPKSDKGVVQSHQVSQQKQDTSKIDELYNHLLEQVKAATAPPKPPKHKVITAKKVLKSGKPKDTSPKSSPFKGSKAYADVKKITGESKELNKKKVDTNSKVENKAKNVSNKGGKEKSRTKPVVGQKRKASEPVTIETDDESNSDDGVLYSLSDMEESDSTPTKSPEQTAKEKSASDSAIDKELKPVVKVKRMTKPMKSQSESGVEKPQKPKKIRLLDSLTKSGTVKPVRPVSPTPLFTAVKTAAVIPTTSSSRRNNRAGGIPMYQYVIQPSAAVPISPTSMSYKMLLENLPHQLHPKKNKTKSQDDGEEDVERRISVRASECAFKYKEIIIKKCHKYTQIWLYTHTKMKNSLNPQVILELQSALNAAKYDDSNLVMLSGLGNVFCSGIDLQFLLSGDRKVVARQMVDALRDFTKTLITFPKLIVAVVTGPAIGLGMTMLPLCDVVYASDKATFFLPYAQLCQTPEGCSSYTFPQALGMAMANELLIGGRKITAIEACQLGLVSQVYWPTSMMQEVIPRVQNMAQSSGKVLETTKLLIRSHQRTKLDLTNESESNLLLERWSSTECQKAITEFLNDETNYTF